MYVIYFDYVYPLASFPTSPPLLSCPFWILLVFSDSMGIIGLTYESMGGEVVYKSTDTLPVALSLVKISLPFPEGINYLQILRVLGVGGFLCPSLLHDGISIGPIFCKYCVATHISVNPRLQ